MLPFSHQTDFKSPLNNPLSPLSKVLDELSPEENVKLSRSAKRIMKRIDNALHAFLSDLPETILPAYTQALEGLGLPYLTVLQDSQLLPRATQLLCEYFSASAPTPASANPSIPKPRPAVELSRQVLRVGAGATALAELASELIRIFASISHEERKNLEGFADQLMAGFVKHLSHARVHVWLTDPGQLGAIMRSGFAALTDRRIFPRTATTILPYALAYNLGGKAS